MCTVEKFQAAELHERDIAPGQFNLQRAAVVRRPEQHRLLIQGNARFQVFEYLRHDEVGLLVLRVITLAVVAWGVYSKVQIVWDAADASMAVMASINLVAIVLLSGVVAKLTRDYDAQLDAGRAPEFRIAEHTELADGVDAEIWRAR